MLSYIFCQSKKSKCRNSLVLVDALDMWTYFAARCRALWRAALVVVIGVVLLLCAWKANCKYDQTPVALEPFFARRLTPASST